MGFGGFLSLGIAALAVCLAGVCIDVVFGPAIAGPVMRRLARLREQAGQDVNQTAAGGIAQVIDRFATCIGGGLFAQGGERDIAASAQGRCEKSE